MNNVPNKLKKEWSKKPPVCCARYHEGGCQGRLTKEHVIIYAGSQLQEDWAIIDLCEFHHAVNKHLDGGNLNKGINLCIALNRATDEQLAAISKLINYKKERERLNKLYPFVLENMAKPFPEYKPPNTLPAENHSPRFEAQDPDVQARLKISYASRILSEAYLLNGDKNIKGIRDLLETYLIQKM